MREEGSSNLKVTFVRKRKFSGVVSGVPGEWNLELAVEGTPHPQSGMILNLIDIDQMLDEEILSIDRSAGSASIPDADLWLSRAGKKISVQIKRLTLSSESASSDASFVSIAIDDGEFRYLSMAPKN